jgi:hypothetical protein
MSEHVTVEELGPARLGPIAARMAEPQPAFAGVMTAIEAQERSVFAGYEGRYVETGALRASLTETAAAGAIRELTPTGATFGSSIFYARFQGTTGSGSHGPPSAILRASQAEASLAARAIKDYVLYGVSAP